MREGDLPRVGPMLARAFAADPTTDWLFDPGARRQRRLARWYTLNAAQLLDAGEGWVTDDLASAALWLPMGGAPVHHRPHLGRQLGLNLRVALGLGRRLPRALRVQLRVHSLHPRGPAWYLAVLGTEPSRQGSGLGSAVLQPVLRRCDQEGVAATLDTVTDEDVRFYEKRGFRVVAEVNLPGSPHFRIMRRPPQPHGPS